MIIQSASENEERSDEYCASERSDGYYASSLRSLFLSLRSSLFAQRAVIVLTSNSLQQQATTDQQQREEKVFPDHQQRSGNKRKGGTEGLEKVELDHGLAERAAGGRQEDRVKNNLQHTHTHTHKQHTTHETRNTHKQHTAQTILL